VTKLIDNFFLIFGVIIFLGFIAEVLFKKFKISNIITLMLLGFIIGPLLGLADVSDGGIIKSVYPIVGTLAFIIIMFDAGAKLNINRIMTTLPKATLFTILVFVFNLVLLTLFLNYFIDWPFLEAALFSAVVGGISSPIVISLVRNLPITDKVKEGLIFESTITDVLCVLTSVIIIQIIINGAETLTINSISVFFISTFSISIVFGALAAILWIAMLFKLPKGASNYILTMAMLFVVYALTEYSGGNGAISVLIFGIFAGHLKEIGQFIVYEELNVIDSTFLNFHDEITFFVRTFFFVYLGLLISISYINPVTLFYSLLVLFIAVLVRIIAKFFVFPDLRNGDAIVVNTMVPRGLAAAVLAFYPLTYGIHLVNSFEEIVFIVILITNLFPSFIVYLYWNVMKKDDGSSGKSEQIKNDLNTLAVE